MGGERWLGGGCGKAVCSTPLLVHGLHVSMRTLPWKRAPVVHFLSRKP